MEIIVIAVIIGIIIYAITRKRHTSSTITSQLADKPSSSVMSKLQGTIIVESFSDPGKTYTVNINNLSCSCPDYGENRSKFSLDDPRRLCKHLMETLAKGKNVPSSVAPIKQIIDRFARQRHKGFPIYDHRITTSIDGRNLEILADTIDEKGDDVSWIGIIYDGHYYTYGAEIGKWVTSRTDVTPGPPPNEKEIVEVIKNNISKFDPKPWPETCIKTLYRNKGKQQYSIKGEVRINNQVMYVGNGFILWAYLNYDSESFSVPVSDYFSIVVNFKANRFNFPDRTKHMEKAVIKWLTDEYSHYQKNLHED
jgi:hypothetical protein